MKKAQQSRVKDFSTILDPISPCQIWKSVYYFEDNVPASLIFEFVCVSIYMNYWHGYHIINIMWYSAENPEKGRLVDTAGVFTGSC